MSNEMYIDGLGITEEVLETIVLLAVQEVEGVAGVGSSAPTLLLGSRNGGKQSIRTGIFIRSVEDGLAIRVRMQVFYGFRLVDVADQVRSSISRALFGQLAIPVSSVDVMIDGLVFPQGRR